MSNADAGREVAQQRRSAADRGEYRQAAGAARSGYVTLQDGTQACFVVLPTDGFDNIDNYRRHETLTVTGGG
jgi:hypothetical protein